MTQVKIYIALTIAFLSGQALATQLASYCEQTDSELFSGLIPCPISRKVVKGQFCIISRTPLVYTNGCSSGKIKLSYNKLFFPACVAHDLCYNSEPQTTGLSQRACDYNFYSYMKHLCKNKDDKCFSAAWSYFKAVRLIGKEYYNCANEDFDYTDFLRFPFSTTNNNPLSNK